MHYLMGLAQDQAPGLAVRPLLYAAGAAAATAGLFYCTQLGGDGKRIPEDEVGVNSSDSAVPEDSASASNEEDEVFSAPVDSEKFHLENRVMELEELLSKAQRACSTVTNEFKQEREAHSVLKSQYKQLWQSLQKYDQERERESVVLKENFHQMKETLTCKDTLLQNLRLSLSEAERKYEQAMESNADLERDMYKLALDMEFLQDSAQDREDALTQTVEDLKKDQDALSTVKARYKWMKRNLQRELTRKQHQYNILRIQYRRMMDNVKKQKQLLVNIQMAQTEAEVKYDMLMETNAELRRENSELISDTNVLQDHVHELEKKLMKMQGKNVNITNDCKQAEKDYGILQSRYEETLNQLDDVLKEEKYEVLLSQVRTLQDSVQNLEAELQDARTKLVAIRKKKAQDRELYNVLQLQYREMREAVKMCEELLKKHSCSPPSQKTILHTRKRNFQYLTVAHSNPP